MSDRHPSYRFALEHSTHEGRALGRAFVEPDFQPVREWAYFEAVRRGRLPLVTAQAGGAVEPIWSEEGPPLCKGIRILGSELSNGYFFELACERAAAYVATGELDPGESFHYRVLAHPAEPGDTLPPALLEFDAEPLAEAVELAARPLAELEAASTQVGEQDPLDAPVLVAESVLREARALAEQAGEVEAGGVLIGHLHRDAGGTEVIAEVVAQLPARHAEADGTSFAFTPETWAAADAALALRGADERILGWWHSHPNFCRTCPDGRRRACSFARPFFSREDGHLHRTCFPQAWQLALLVSDLPDDGWTPALFGWREGRIVERGYRTLPDAQKENR